MNCERRACRGGVIRDESSTAPPEIEHAGKVKGGELEGRGKARGIRSRWMEHREGEEGKERKESRTEGEG